MTDKIKTILCFSIKDVVLLTAVFTVIFFGGCSFNKDKTDFAGQWNSETKGVTVDISLEENDCYLINVTAQKDEDSIYSWEMEGQIQKNGLVYSGGSLYEVSYDQYGNALEELVYEDGSGSFEIRNHMLFWEDEKEGFGDSITLEKSDAK